MDNRRAEGLPWKCFRCESEDHLITECTKQVCFNENLILHETATNILLTAIYMHLWHECLATKNGKIMVRLKTETEHFCKRGDIVQEKSMEQKLCMAILN